MKHDGMVPGPDAPRGSLLRSLRTALPHGRLSAVRWGIAGNIVVTWVITMPAAAVISALSYLAAGLVF